jgi:hypothetical protein
MSRFAAVPTAALDDERLEALHIRVLTALCSYSDKDGWCRVGQDKIAARARTNPARVSSCITALAEWGWVRKQRIGKMRVNVYQVVMDRAFDASIDLPPEQIAEPASQNNCPPGKSDLPPEQITIAPPANPIRTPSSNTASSADFDARRNAMARVLEACGPGMVDQTKSANPLLDLKARIGKWLAAWDLESEILPVVQAKTQNHRQRPMTHFGFIEEDIAAFHAKRIQPVPTVEVSNERAGQGQSGRNSHGRGNRGARSGREHGASAYGAAFDRLFGGDQEANDVPYEPIDGRDERVA